MHLPIHLSPSDGVPIYVQIVQQVKLLVASGRLEAERELPPIRVLAEQLTINPNTVARAYRELELAGIVYKRRTSGTYVSGAGSPFSEQERIRLLTDRVDALIAEARQLGFSTDDVVAHVRDRDRELDREAVDL